MFHIRKSFYPSLVTDKDSNTLKKSLGPKVYSSILHFNLYFFNYSVDGIITASLGYSACTHVFVQIESNMEKAFPRFNSIKY